MAFQDMTFDELQEHIRDLKSQISELRDELGSAQAELETRRRAALPPVQQPRNKDTVVVKTPPNIDINKEADDIIDDFGRYGRIKMTSIKGNNLYITYDDYRDADDAFNGMQGRYNVYLA